MKYSGASIFSGCIFLVAAFFGGMFPFSSAHARPGNESLENYREMLDVKEGVSQDGQLAITKIPNAPTIPPRAKSSNHARVLRAFFAPDRGGTLTLYVENVRPHRYYSLAGAFRVLEEYPVLAWGGETALAFYGTSPKGDLLQYTADVHLLTLSQKPVDPIVPIPTKNVPSSDLLP